MRNPYTVAGGSGRTGVAGKEQTMRELVYKDEAYKAIDNCIRDGWDRISPSEAKMNIRHLVSDVSEADRPQGEWYQIKDHKVMGEGYLWHCSLCGHRVYQDSSANYPTENYCPTCGARMKGADDEVR